MRKVVLLGNGMDIMVFVLVEKFDRRGRRLKNGAAGLRSMNRKLPQEKIFAASENDQNAAPKLPGWTDENNVWGKQKRLAL